MYLPENDDGMSVGRKARYTTAATPTVSPLDPICRHTAQRSYVHVRDWSGARVTSHANMWGPLVKSNRVLPPAPPPPMHSLSSISSHRCVGGASRRVPGSVGTVRWREVGLEGDICRAALLTARLATHGRLVKQMNNGNINKINKIEIRH